jgi:hypothetical protein
MTEKNKKKKDATRAPSSELRASVFFGGSGFCWSFVALTLSPYKQAAAQAAAAVCC